MDNYRKKFYITTPIYYVNDKPHIGHAYTTLLGDVLAEYHGLFGEDTFLLTGTDEHGQKVEKAAFERGISPEEHSNEYVKRFKQLWEKLSIRNNDFIRTTEPRHKRVVEAVLTDLYGKGEIYKGNYTGWYCTPCERFFMEKDLVKGLCPECKRTVEEIKEDNYFFAMSKYQQWLVDYIEKKPDFIQPDFRRNETLGFLKKKLGDLCISRPKSRLSWGIELPFDRDYVCYVWFDALINYISAIGFKSDDKRFRYWWPVDYHLIGKDILTTHTVYWPAMIRAIGIEQPRTIFAHGWWLLEGDKISKSKGNAVDPLSLLDKYGIDAFRYFLLADMSLGHDAVFSEERFVTRYNSDLANNLGNLTNRIIKLIDSSCKGIIPSTRNVNEVDNNLKSEIIGIAGAVENDVYGLRIDNALSKILKGCSLINQYLENTEPWKLRRNELEKERLEEVLGNSIEALRIVSGLLYPVIPAKIAKLRECIGISEYEKIPNLRNLKNWGDFLQGKKVKAGKVLFPRIE